MEKMLMIDSMSRDEVCIPLVNVAAVAIAKTHALGLAYWNKKDCIKLSGKAIAVCAASRFLDG